jgi:hypothetical protein
MRGMATLHVYSEPKLTSLSYQTRWNISRKSTVEVDFSRTINQVEMDCSKYKTLKRGEMDFSMTTQKAAEQM